MADLWMKAGDLQPRWDVVFRDASGDPVDITGTDITVSMRRIRGDRGLILDRVPAINDQVDPDSVGHAHYQPQAGDTDEPGGFYVEFRANFADGDETFPNATYLRLAILPALIETGS